MPTPSASRLLVSAATDAACLATSTGGRTGSLSTNGVNRSVVVTAPIAAHEHERLDEVLVLEEGAGCRPACTGYVLSDSFGIGQAVGDRDARVAGRLGRLGQRQVVAGIGHRLGVGESHCGRSSIGESPE